MQVQYDFSGKQMVVAGGASGMGRSVVRSLAAAGAAVSVVDRNLELAQALCRQLTAQGASARAYYMDATAPESARQAAEAVAAAAGRIDGLVNSIGIGAKALDGEALQETFARVVQVNLLGMFHSCWAFGEQMIATGGGSVVNIASMSASVVPAKTRPGRGGEYGLLGYCASKGGVKMMTKAMALLWTEYGMRANSVSPGYVDTPLTAEPHSDPETRRRLEQSVPLGRIAQPEEIAASVLFLLSEDAAYLTGQDLVIDGGFTSR